MTYSEVNIVSNTRATKAVIHLENLRHNIEQIREKVGPDCRICMPVKANAYGHGSVPVSRAAVEYGVDTLAVAAVCEGRELREQGIDVPVLLLNHVLPEEVADLLAARLTPLAGDKEYLSLLQREGEKEGIIVDVHLKVDTGMGRLGCRPEEAQELVRFIHDSSFLHLDGLATHYPVSDSDDPGDRVFTLRQTDTFRELAEQLEENGFHPGTVHAANSGAVATLPVTYFDMVRPGIALYGYEPLISAPLGVKPVMELETRIVSIKKIDKGDSISYGRTWIAESDTVIGLLPVGYGDGYNRLLSNRGKVLINGKLYPVIGRICMDITMVDLGAHPDVRLHDKAVLFGPDPVGHSAQDIADIIDTIPYEVTCNISPRVPRVYRV